MVKKLAHPPTKLEIGSAKKTPCSPMAGILGSKIVKGTTITILRNSENVISYFASPSA